MKNNVEIAKFFVYNKTGISRISRGAAGWN